MARPRKAVVEGAVLDQEQVDRFHAAMRTKMEAETGGYETGKTLAADIEYAVMIFRRQFPEHWRQIRLCPLEYGLNDMIEALSR